MYNRRPPTPTPTPIGGNVWDALGGRISLEEVVHWGRALGLYRLAPLPVYSQFLDCKFVVTTGLMLLLQAMPSLPWWTILSNYNLSRPLLPSIASVRYFITTARKVAATQAKMVVAVMTHIRLFEWTVTFLCPTVSYKV